MINRKNELKTLMKFGLPWTFFLLIFTILLGDYVNPFRPLEGKWFDFKFVTPYFAGIADYLGLAVEANSRINIVAIDEFSTRKYGWPFKRRYYAPLLANLEKYGVKVVGFDVMFFDKDRDNPENDAALISALKKYPRTINLVTIENLQIKKPIDGVMENSLYMAQPHADTSMDGDGHIRRMNPFFPPYFLDSADKQKTFYYEDLEKLGAKKRQGTDKSGIPLLGLAVYAAYSDLPLNVISSEWFGKSLRLKFRYPQDRYKHRARKEFQGKDEGYYCSPFRHISAADIIEDKLSAEEKNALNGAIALIGATATGAFDHYPSPFSALTPGVEFHATLIDNLMKGDYLRPVGLWFKFFMLIFSVWLPIILQPKKVKVITWAVILAVFFIGALSIFLLRENLDMDFVPYFVGLLISYIYVMAYKSIVESREKKWIKNTFSQYLSPKVVDIIVRDPSKLVLGGERRDMTVFYMDIAGFTTMSERLSPEELTGKLNYYLSELTEVIHRHDGVVDKYIGDCIMAFWNAPLNQEKHRTLSCKTAIDCIKKVEELNKSVSENDRISVRIGINSGPMVVGNMGSNTRFAYTVLGDNVNLASRLESANKFFHSRIMVSKNVYEEAKSEIYARFLGSIKVAGKTLPVDVYEPVCLLSEMQSMPVYKEYEKGIEYFYNRDYDKAAKCFKVALELDRKDGPSAFYLDLCGRIISGEERFDGVFTLTGK